MFLYSTTQIVKYLKIRDKYMKKLLLSFKAYVVYDFMSYETQTRYTGYFASLSEIFRLGVIRVGVV